MTTKFSNIVISIIAYAIFSCTSKFNHAVLQHYTIITESLYTRHIMTDEQYCSPLPSAHILHLSNRLLLKLGITDSQHFVNDKDFRLQMGGYGEAEADGHA